MTTNSEFPTAALERIRAELQLHDRAMGASSCGITIADANLPEMPLIYINDAFTRITGYTPQDTLGRNCRFLQREDRDQQGLTDLRVALTQGKDCTILLRNYRKDGELFWNELFTSPILDEQGRLTHFIGVQTDVTQRIIIRDALQTERDALAQALAQLRDTQAMLIHSEKMNALGQLVAGVAHEINNPISYVTSNLHSLNRTVADIFDTYRALEKLAQGATVHQTTLTQIRQDADLDFAETDTVDLLRASLGGLERVRQIVEGLRTFARLDESAIKFANLRENIESTLMLASVELRNRINTELDFADLPEILCNPAALNQVFLNLIVNAAQAIPGEGKLTIRGRATESEVILTFTDTGEGIPPEVLPRIFDPFFTTKPVGKGTGLGLSIAYNLITVQHHGTITADSIVGVGTTFTITLPKDKNS